jgi:hypothetical protein
MKLVGSVKTQGVDQHVRRDVDKRRGTDDRGARCVGRADENEVDARHGAGAVFWASQVELEDLGARESGLQGLLVDGEPQIRALGGQSEREIGANEAPAPGHKYLFAPEIHLSLENADRLTTTWRKIDINPDQSRDRTVRPYCFTGASELPVTK